MLEDTWGGKKEDINTCTNSMHWAFWRVRWDAWLCIDIVGTICAGSLARRTVRREWSGRFGWIMNHIWSLPWNTAWAMEWDVCEYLSGIVSL